MTTQSGSSSLWQAIGLVCLASFLFVIMNSIVKSLTGDYPIAMLIWARFFFHVVTVVVLFPNRVAGFWRAAQPGVQVARSVLLMGSTVTNFAALGFLPLGEVTAITFTSPIIVAGLAVLILRENVAVVRWLAVLTGFAGVLMVVQPGANSFNLGVVLALACAGCYAVYQISTRIVREAEPIVSLFYSGLVGMVLTTLILPWHWQTPTPTDLGLLVLVGALGATGHLMVIMALQRGEASRVSPFNYTHLVWATLASYLVFGDVPRWTTLAGAAVIVASGLWLWRLDTAELRRARAAA
jgi:drug/metabolite transporter (DMT)-like permease